MHVPARPVNYSRFVRLSMVIMVLVQLVATLGLLKLAVNRLTSLLADICQASSKPVQQGLQVSAHHVKLPSNGQSQLQHSL